MLASDVTALDRGERGAHVLSGDNLWLNGVSTNPVFPNIARVYADRNRSRIPSAMRRMARDARSFGDRTEAACSKGTTMTSVFERRLRRVVLSSRPVFSNASIFASSAEKKISAGAPSSICRPRCSRRRTEAILIRELLFVSTWQFPSNLSVRLAAAKHVHCRRVERQKCSRNYPKTRRPLYAFAGAFLGFCAQCSCPESHVLGGA